MLSLWISLLRKDDLANTVFFVVNLHMQKQICNSWKVTLPFQINFRCLSISSYFLFCDKLVNTLGSFQTIYAKQIISQAEIYLSLIIICSNFKNKSPFFSHRCYFKKTFIFLCFLQFLVLRIKACFIFWIVFYLNSIKKYSAVMIFELFGFSNQSFNLYWLHSNWHLLSMKMSCNNV